MKKSVLILTTIITLAFFLRIINIENVPPGIYPDEAQNGWDAYIAWQSDSWRWFYPDNNGREGLYINLIAGTFALFGVSVLTLKLVSVLAGTLTVLGTYLLSREIFWRCRFGVWFSLAAAFFVSVSFWHINFSRIAFRAILLPLVLTFSFWLLLRALRLLKKSASSSRAATPGSFGSFLRYSPGVSFFVGGLIFGLGLHTYIAWRIAPAVLIVLFVALLLTREFALRQLIKPAIVFAAGVLIGAAPLLATFYQNPEYLSGRSSVSVFDPANNGGNLPGTLAKTIGLSLAMFNFYGDQNWRHGFPPYPTLEPLTGLLFLLGFFVAAIYIIRPLSPLNGHSKKEKTFSEIPLAFHWFVLAWFGAMLAPEFLTAEGLPHALRAIGVLPAVYILAALGLKVVIDKLEQKSLLKHPLTIALILTVFIYIGLFGALKYHVYWAARAETAAAFNANLTAIARAVADLPTAKHKIVLAGPLERLPVKLLNTQTENLVFVYESEIKQLQDTREPTVIFVTDDWPHIVGSFRDVFGNLNIRRHDELPGSVYFTLIPR